MSDARLQDIRRSAALGDPGAEARLLVEGLRAGLLTRERVELAAYCGHEGAQSLLKPGATRYAPWCPCDLGAPFGPHTDCCEFKPWQFSRWVHGLSRWGPDVLVRASVAAARAALPTWEQSADGSGPDATHCDAHSDKDGSGPWPQSVLDCAICTDHGPRSAIAAAESWLAGGGRLDARPASMDGRYDRDPWWSLPLMATDDAAARNLPQRYTPASIASAALIAGEQPVREAIQSCLVSWSLGEQP